jgi:hypothetical protein
MKNVNKLTIHVITSSEEKHQSTSYLSTKIQNIKGKVAPVLNYYIMKTYGGVGV